MNKRILLALLHREIGSKLVRAVLGAFRSTNDLNPEEVMSYLEPHLSPNALARLNDLVNQDETMRLLQKKLDLAGVTVITMHDRLYPPSLLALGSPPPLLYVKGDLDKVQLPGIGICGSRKASQKGLKSAEKFGQMAASEGIPEISGYAQGVDARAHLGALKEGGMTVAVIAEGILRFRHKKVFSQIPNLGSQMVVLSEFHAERPWHVSTAMQRNKTICGLSSALVVVEANESGGTLDAGMKCLKQEKPLLVIDYSTASEMPPGNLRLIDSGGISVGSSNDLKMHIKAAMSKYRTSSATVGHQSRLLV